MSEQRRESGSVGQAVGEAIVRLRRFWPHQLDGPEIIAEYRRILRKASSPRMLCSVIDQVIDETTDGYLPRPGVFAKAIDEARSRTKAEPLAIPDGAQRNRCPVCAQDPPGIREGRKVIVDERTGIASCSEGLHGYTWFVAGPQARGVA